MFPTYRRIVFGILKQRVLAKVKYTYLAYLSSTPAAFLPSGHWLPRALNTEVRICIEASYVVLASCVIEMRINIRADDVTTWLIVLRGELRPAVRDQAYELRSPQVRSCWDGDKNVPWSTE